MQEALLHHIWKFRLFDMNELITESGESLQIIHPGKHNTDAGPDFFDARIKIGETLWAGNVELHIKASDWQKHHHQNDTAYDNVILHVVYENDERGSGSSSGSGSGSGSSSTLKGDEVNMQKNIPVLELKSRINHKILKSYDGLMLNQNKIPCSGNIKNVDGFTISGWLDRLLVERLEQKTKSVELMLQQNNGNWEDAFYIHIARNFGFKINAVPFELLARSLPLQYLAKHKNDLFQIEALLFGQAGLLQSDFNDDYPLRLKKEYEFLKSKFGLQNMSTHLWKFLRLRPVNFPTIRIAQFAKLVHNSSHLFSKLIELKDVRQVYELFDVNVSDYWLTHFMFDKVSKQSDKHLGKASVENIVINTIVPFLFYYGKQKDNSRIQNRALQFLEQTGGEINNITKQWIFLKVKCENAYHSQALIQLYNFYCSEKKCLFCAIGNKILRQ